MRKGQADSPILMSVVIALMIPLIIIMMYMVQVSIENSTEGTLTVPVVDDLLAAGANVTALSFASGNANLYSVTGLTFNATDKTEDVNYTVDYSAGTVTWIDTVSNESDYAVDYEYFPRATKATFDLIASNTGNAYDMAGILPIAIVGIAVLAAIIGALAGFVLLRR